jgi:PhoPQ-activated pathogenicity-related protein
MIFILKAAVRAMDATQEFLRQKEIQVPEKFIVAGGSKVS